MQGIDLDDMGNGRVDVGERADMDVAVGVVADVGERVDVHVGVRANVGVHVDVDAERAYWAAR